METDQLVERLSSKLVDLESRMQTYRQGLLANFQQYYNDLICNVADQNQAAKIYELLCYTFDDYPALRPQLIRPADSLPQVHPSDTETTTATFQLLSSTANSGNSDAPERPRDRDSELQGLFTPSFLPLLDGGGQEASLPRPHSNLVHTPGSALENISPAAVFELAAKPDEMDKHARRPEVMTGSALPPLQSSVDDNEAVVSRSPADDANSSVSSDKSDSKVRRSALRRSPSASKTPQSPRRVRFEFMGAEVLPTASPQPPTYINARASSPSPVAGDNISADSILGGDDSDSDPPPRKISSSDALRALSRAAAEDGTVWTVVNADSDMSSDSKAAQANSTTSSSSSDSTFLPREAYKPALFYTGPESGEMRLSGDVFDSTQDQVEDNSSEDEGLSLSKTRPTATKTVGQTTTKPSILPVRSATNTESNKKLGGKPVEDYTKSGKDTDLDNEDDVHDDMFEFETEPGMKPITKLTRPPPETDVDLENGDDAAQEEKGSISLLSSSLAKSVPISQPKADLTSPTVSKFTAGSIGSYKGRPVMMPIVKNPAVHARAASLGNVTTFVGGLDGSSGLDEGDISSYRASVVAGGFVGTPRSFTERFIMEEMQKDKDKL